MSFAKPDPGLHGKPVDNPPLPCRGCGDLTSKVTLLNCGGWCFPCFQSYCRDTPVQRPYVESQTVRDMKTRLRGRLDPPDFGRKAA